MLGLLGEVGMLEGSSERPQNVEKGLWMCIGDAYVHGIIDGEAWPDNDGDNEMESIFVT